MGKVAIMFSGQGAQYPGMGKELYRSSQAARAIFDMADSIRPGTSKQCFEGSKEELCATINTQPCIFAMDLAAAAAITEAGVSFDGAAGFSLGEIAGIAYTGMLSPDQAFSLACERAKLMEMCAKKQKGAMLAILKMSPSEVERLCKESGEAYPVNYNYAGQTVAAGTQAGIEKLENLVAENGGRSLKLPVGGAFHSPLMQPAVSDFKEVLSTLDFQNGEIPLYSNITAEPYGGDVKNLVARQIVSPVRWSSIVENMMSEGFDTFIEAGPGKTLCGIVRKISPDVQCYNVEDSKSLSLALENMRVPIC